MTISTIHDTIDPNQYAAFVFTGNTDIISASGSHLFYIGSGFDTLTAVGGSQMVFAYGGNSTINLAATHDDSIFFSGGNNVITAGSGTNVLYDESGSGDRIVLPAAGKGFDQITLMSGADAKLDFSSALKATDWDGKAADLGGYITVAPIGGVAMISLSSTAHGAATAVGAVSNLGGAAWGLSTVLAHVVTS